MPSRMMRYVTKVVLGLTILLLLFGFTAEFLPHHHNSEFSERVCQLCHPRVMSVQQAALQLPAPITISWTIDLPGYLSKHTTPVRRNSSRAPPAA